MAQELHVRAGGAWRKATEVHVKVSGVWVPIKEVWIKDGGTWRQAFATVFVASITISADVNNYNLNTALTGLGWNGTSPVIVDVTINSGVKIGSTSQTTPAFTLGVAYPATSVINIVNNGKIMGAGGKGGETIKYLYGGSLALDGGTAVKALSNVTITNNGTIYGGGGGGGPGSLYSTPNPGDPGNLVRTGGSGGGGAGIVAGIAGGQNYPPGTDLSPDLVTSNGAPGSDGTETSGGAGGAKTTGSGDGGAGGGPGQAGIQGKQSIGANNGFSVGAAGKYIEGNAFVTWATTGTRLGGVS